ACSSSPPTTGEPGQCRAGGRHGRSISSSLAPSSSTGARSPGSKLMTTVHMLPSWLVRGIYAEMPHDRHDVPVHPVKALFGPLLTALQVFHLAANFDDREVHRSDLGVQAEDLSV